MAEDDPWLLAKFYEFLGDYYSTQKPLLARNSYQKALKELNQYYFHTKISYFQIQLALKLIKCNVDQSFYQDAENLIRNLYSKIGLNTKYINQDVSFNQYNQLTLNLLKLNLLLNRKTKKENITSNSNLITSSAIILRNIFYSYPFDDSKYSYFERNNSHFEDLIRYSIYESEVTSPNKKLEDCILLFELNKAQKLVSDVEKNQKLYSDTFRYKEFLEITNEIRAVKEIINVKEGSGIECNLEKSRLLALEVIRRDLFFMSGREKKLFNLNVNSKYNLQKLKDYFNDHRDETLIELYEGVNDVYIFSLSYKKDTCFIVHKSDLEFHTIKRSVF
ncbi:MAG: hypothetical protein R2784_10770 [Saprospiraceae bacterium]